MSDPLPEFYTALGPFRDHFERDGPILMYHKVGKRPPGTRFRALYISARLFAIQMRELKTAGFQAVSLGRLLDANRPLNSFVITFDDGFANVLQNAAPILAEAGFSAIQFIVSNLIGGRNEWDVRVGEVPERLMDKAEIRDWLAAGHEIGSHTRTHCRLPRLSLRDAAEEVSASKKQLEDIFGLTIRHFCYPYGETTPAVQEVVAQAGYETACTIQTGFNRFDSPPFELHRFLARYPSRRIKSIHEGFSLLRSL